MPETPSEIFELITRFEYKKEIDSTDEQIGKLMHKLYGVREEEIIIAD